MVEDWRYGLFKIKEFKEGVRSTVDGVIICIIGNNLMNLNGIVLIPKRWKYSTYGNFRFT